MVALSREIVCPALLTGVRTLPPWNATRVAVNEAVRVIDGVRELVRVSVGDGVIVSVTVNVLLAVLVDVAVRVLVLVADRVLVPVPITASLVALNESVSAVWVARTLVTVNPVFAAITLAVAFTLASAVAVRAARAVPVAIARAVSVAR
jgi:hypothetical protein